MRLTDYLREHKLTHTEFATRIGATQAAVTRYANGQRKPSLDKLILIERETNGAVRARDFADLTGTELVDERAKPLRCLSTHGLGEIATEGQSR